MSEPQKTPTHYRLMSAFKAIGPYVRESKSIEGYYLFDCLAVCVSDKKSPEEREFWGWWLALELQEKAFVARYHTGLYDVSANWVEQKLPKKAVEEVNRTQENFHKKLVETLDKQFGMSLALDKESVEFV